MHSSRLDAKRKSRNRSLPVWAKTVFSGLRVEGIERDRANDAPNWCATWRLTFFQIPAFWVQTLSVTSPDGSAPAEASLNSSHFETLAKLLVNWHTRQSILTGPTCQRVIETA